MALLDAALDLGEHRFRATAARGSTHERDHAERAREAAAVLHLDEGAHAIEPRFRLDARDRADVARRPPPASPRPPPDDDDVLRDALERILPEVRRATGDVDTAVRAREASDGLARLRDRLVRHAARADDGDVGDACALRMAVGEQALANRMGVDVRHLAAEKTDREGRHRRQRYSSLAPHVRGPAVELARGRSRAQPNWSKASAAR